MNEPRVILDPVKLADCPVTAYCEQWGRKPETLRNWCAKGWVPGAYKHKCGDWFVSPMLLIGWDTETVILIREASERNRVDSEEGRQVPCEGESGRRRGVRPVADNVRSSRIRFTEPKGCGKKSKASSSNPEPRTAGVSTTAETPHVP